VTNTKSGKDRVIPLNQDARAALETVKHVGPRVFNVDWIKVAWTAALTEERSKILGFTICAIRRRRDLPTRVRMLSRSRRFWGTVRFRCRRVTLTRPTKENDVLLKEYLGAKIPVTYRSHN
ncbi:MAG TPA: hypothetical protein VLM38_24960, partial [Blastocatellia bacterium]|nr:hypothetical protein [Blastocatellia bacterium]